MFSCSRDFCPHVINVWLNSFLNLLSLIRNIHISSAKVPGIVTFYSKLEFGATCMFSQKFWLNENLLIRTETLCNIVKIYADS